VIRVLDWRGESLDPQTVFDRVPRVSAESSDVDQTVQALIDDVRERGSDALLDHAERFDRCRPAGLKTPQSAIDTAVKELDPALRVSIERAIAHVRAGSALQVPERKSVEVVPGGTISQRWQPVERAGVYVPGGKAVYPSSVVMNVVAAQTAGVKHIALASPPQADFEGEIHPTILATAGLLGVTEVYRMGGASAIGALAYGVVDLDLAPVSVITGPGNMFVAAAKRLVKGRVGIDSEAGPTEIVVIADDTAQADFVAADLISQAEHDELAQSILITTSEELATRVQSAITQRLSTTTHRERVETSLAGVQSAVIIVDSREDAVVVSDELAPEHLEIMVENPEALVEKITHAGAIFVGDYTPVSAGDYLAGSNHVLPTSGQAKFQSGLSAMTFLRPQQIVHYNEMALRDVGDDIVRFANAEDLPAHGQAVTARFHRSED
jgi:histidinol dehydrogenase